MDPHQILIKRFNERFEVYVKDEKVITSTDFDFLQDLVTILNRAGANHFVKSFETVDFDVSGI